LARSEITCFAVSDGRRGIENQALGLAEALGELTPVRIMPVQVPRTGEIPDPGPIAPEVWIGCGRAAVRASASHRQAFPDAVFVYVQDPRAAHHRFDLIIPPLHDRLTGDNVFPILGSPNRVTPGRLAEAERSFSGRIAALPDPRAAVLIGGDSKHHRFTPEVGAYLMHRLEFLRAKGLGLMITTSRRTPEEFTARLAERFADDDGVWLHDGTGPNPYFAFLGGADWIFVTEDSTNMLTEAAATGTPVYRLPLEGDAGKFARLYAQLEGHGAVRPFLGRLDRWTYAPLDETTRAARKVLEMLGRGEDLRQPGFLEEA
jgi:uncharacterized protein